jgi:nitroreductase
MDVFEAIEKRKSTRSYQPTPVPKETVTKLLEAARIAPSAGNVQPWHFIVVTDADQRRALSKGTFAKFLAEAPLVIVGCGDTKASPDWNAVDTSLALQNIALAATAEGLATCFVGSFKEEDIKPVLKLPDKFSVIAMLAVGYSTDKESLTAKLIRMVRKRKNLQDITSIETFGQTYMQA